MKKKIIFITSLCLLLATILCSCGIFGAKDNTTVLVLGGHKVNYDEYSYYYYLALEEAPYYKQYFDDERSIEEIAHANAVEDLRFKYGVYELALSMNLVLSASERKRIDTELKNERSEFNDYYGKGVWESEMALSYFTPHSLREFVRFQYTWGYLYDYLIEPTNYDPKTNEPYIKYDRTSVLDFLLGGEDVFAWKQIFIPIAAGINSAASAREKAQLVIEELNAGADFSDVAAPYYIYSDEDLGMHVDMYEISVTGLLNLLWEDAILNLKVGEISGIVETEYGCHIFMRCDINENDSLHYIDNNYQGLVDMYTAKMFNDMVMKIGNDLELVIKTEDLIYGKG